MVDSNINKNNLNYLSLPVYKVLSWTNLQTNVSSTNHHFYIIFNILYFIVVLSLFL